VQDALGELGAGLLVEGSAGAGNWAAVPWISIFDPAITTSATDGYYVVYLFHVNKPVVHLSLNQGTTAVRDPADTKIQFSGVTNILGAQGLTRDGENAASNIAAIQSNAQRRHTSTNQLRHRTTFVKIDSNFN
jgi:hypothetical protein